MGNTKEKTPKTYSLRVTMGLADLQRLEVLGRLNN